MTEQSSRLAPRRFVPFQGCVNFRDLGGYPTGDGRTVSWNKLYRSDALNELTEEDVARAVGELGIQTMVDLRNHDEVRRDGAGILAESGPDYHHFPLLEKWGEIPPIEGTDLAERLAVTYQWIVQNSGGLIAEAVTTIARNRGKGGGLSLQRRKRPHRHHSGDGAGRSGRGPGDCDGRLPVDQRGRG